MSTPAFTLPASFVEQYGEDLYHCASCNYCVDVVWAERGIAHVCATLEHHSPAPGYSGRGFIDIARALHEGRPLAVEAVAERVWETIRQALPHARLEKNADARNHALGENG